MRVLVTGAFGFVGTAVVRRLALAGHDVVALTHRAEDASLLQFAGRVVYGDVRDAAATKRAVAGIDAVCHLAAMTRVRESFERPQEYRDVNVSGTRILVAAMRDEAERVGKALRIVHASTGAVYGAPVLQPIREDAEPAPTSPYGESKLAADRLVLDAVCPGLGAVVLRAFNIAGAVDGRTDEDLTRIIPKALAVAKGTAPQLEVNGDGTAVRDFVHVDDLARAYVMAVDQCTAGRSTVFNVGATGASVAEIIETVELVTGVRLRVEHRAPQPEPPQLLADTSKIRAELGWKPERSSLSEIVTDAWTVVASI
jgi:UDP-glucose 4-epimerase